MASSLTPPAHVICESLYASAFEMRVIDPFRAVALFHLLSKLAPTDERGWLGVGACHEALNADDIALSVYTFGQAAARSARCVVARARMLVKIGRDADAEDVVDHALSLSWNEVDTLLLERERERLS